MPSRLQKPLLSPKPKTGKSEGRSKKGAVLRLSQVQCAALFDVWTDVATAATESAQNSPSHVIDGIMFDALHIAVLGYLLPGASSEPPSKLSLLPSRGLKIQLEERDCFAKVVEI